jgi:hypothetical protein
MPTKEAQDKAVQQFRVRAKELRAIADVMADQTVKKRLLKVAFDYEQLALKVETPVVVSLSKHRRA